MSLTITVTFPLNLWVLFWNVYGSSKLPVLSLYRQHPNVRSSPAILSPILSPQVRTFCKRLSPAGLWPNPTLGLVPYYGLNPGIICDVLWFTSIDATDADHYNAYDCTLPEATYQILILSAIGYIRIFVGRHRPQVWASLSSRITQWSNVPKLPFLCPVYYLPLMDHPQFFPCNFVIYHPPTLCSTLVSL